MTVESFEELGLPPELVEALAAEGIERPTPLQTDLIPLLRRGNSALARAGPGGGTLVAYGVPLLERIEPEGTAPRVAVLTASGAAAAALAESLARLGLATGHAVAALGSTWASPERADILFATPADLLATVRASRLRLEDLRALVVDGAATIQRADGLEDLETLVAFLPPTAQRVVISLPVTPEVRSFARAHVKKAGYVAGAELAAKSETRPVRGVVLYRISRKDDADIVRTVADILEEGARHVLVHCRSDDHAADVGDLLSLHGFLAGAPGDPSTPVWLGSRKHSAEASILEGMAETGSVATFSVDVPAGAASLNRRHGQGAAAAVLVVSRELAHLKAIAAEAGYRLRPLPKPPRASSELERRRGELLQVLKEEDLSSEMLLLDPLFERYDPMEVAAAASRLAGRTKGLPAPRRPAVAARPRGCRRCDRPTGRRLAPGARPGVGAPVHDRRLARGNRSGRPGAGRRERGRHRALAGGQDRDPGHLLPCRSSAGGRGEGAAGAERHHPGRAQRARGLSPRASARWSETGRRKGTGRRPWTGRRKGTGRWSGTGRRSGTPPDSADIVSWIPGTAPCRRHDMSAS